MEESSRRLHRASFVVPGNGPVIVDGAVLTEDGLVTAVGPWRDFARISARLEEHEGDAIIPALVNCHAHLELSHLAFLSQDPAPAIGSPDGGITAWIRRLLAARTVAVDAEERRYAAALALARLYAGGCRAVIDIGNLSESRCIGRDFKVEVFFFLELFGLAGEREGAALRTLVEMEAESGCAVHAPYSAGPALIRAAHERARQADRLLPIHLAESAEELEFLRTGGGPFRDFLLERGVPLAAFVTPDCGPVAYLDSLGVLDRKTLCVHGVHLNEEEISLLAERGSAVCLCPGSNRLLGVGQAPVEELLAQGVPLVLGTDSLASNPELSLWREMQVLRQDHPGLDPAQVFAFATINGARLLGIDQRLGLIAPGLASALPAVACPVTRPDEVLDCLTSAGSGISLQWIE